MGRLDLKLLSVVWLRNGLLCVSWENSLTETSNQQILNVILSVLSQRLAKFTQLILQRQCRVQIGTKEKASPNFTFAALRWSSWSKKTKKGPTNLQILSVTRSDGGRNKYWHNVSPCLSVRKRFLLNLSKNNDAMVNKTERLENARLCGLRLLSWRWKRIKVLRYHIQ